MKKILFVGAEAMPFAATGGLGDVMGSLPAALAATGDTDVRVVMPLYSAVSAQWREKMKQETVFYVRLSWRELYCGVYSLQHNGVTYYFIDNEYYFSRSTLYGQYDDGERYAYFCMAALEMLSRLDYYPDVLHAHDWQSALAVIYLKRKYRYFEEYSNMKAVYTIHNIDVGCDIYFSKKGPHNAGEGTGIENEDNYSGRMDDMETGDLVYFEIYARSKNPQANGGYIIVIEKSTT